MNVSNLAHCPACTCSEGRDYLCGYLCLPCFKAATATTSNPFSRVTQPTR